MSAGGVNSHLSVLRRRASSAAAARAGSVIYTRTAIGDTLGSVS